MVGQKNRKSNTHSSYTPYCETIKLRVLCKNDITKDFEISVL